MLLFGTEMNSVHFSNEKAWRGKWNEIRGWPVNVTSSQWESQETTRLVIEPKTNIRLPLLLSRKDGLDQFLSRYLHFSLSHYRLLKTF